MSLSLLSILAIAPSLVVAKPAACPAGSSSGSCTPASDSGEILLHTRTQLSSVSVVENQFSTSAFELDHLGVATLRRDSSLSVAQQTTRSAQQAAWVSYRGTLGTVLSNLDTSSHKAGGELEETIDKFITNQAGSEDACHAQLLETKHQLNQLHMHVKDLAMQVNATDHEITALNNQVQAKLEEEIKLAEECKKKLDEVEKQQAEDLAFLEQLRGELEEMIQIANPDITMNQTGRKVFANGSYKEGGEEAKSLLGLPGQTDKFRSFLARIKLPSHEALLQLHGSSPASLVQMNVQDDGQMTELKGSHDVFASLKLAMNTASQCIDGKQKLSLIGQVTKGGQIHARHHTKTSIQAHHHAHQGPPAEGEGEGEEAPTEKKPTGDAPAEKKPTGDAPAEKKPTEEAPKAEEGANGDAPTLQKGASSSGKDITAGESSEGLDASPTMPPAKDVHCAADADAKVEVGGLADTVKLPRDLAKGETAQIPCVKVNKEYFGAIWLTCNEAGVEGSAKNCLKAANATKCQEELETLQKVYVKTYVDLARLIQSYEEKTTEGYEAAKEAIEDQCRDRREPLQADAAKLASEASEKIKFLEELRPKLEDANDAYRKLAEEVEKLTKQCKALPETITDLDKVRDAIKAMSLCPGLDKARLIVPKWLGTYVAFEEPASDVSDAEYDAMMMQACEKSFGAQYPDKALRAASVAEMQAFAILDLPKTNTAETPLIGPCPGCEGDTDDSTKSGHLRVCWKAGANLVQEERLTTCSEGAKSIACVIDGDK